MSKQEEIITIAGKRVRVEHCTNEAECCDKCCLIDRSSYRGCFARDMNGGVACSQYDGADNAQYAYFVEAEQPNKTNALFEVCVKNCDPKVRAEVRSNIDKIIAEETHSLREWAQILAKNPDLRAEFDKMCPPQPIQGSIAPEADLEAEIERWWNERYANLKKDYKFDSMSGHYLDNEGIIALARHFAEWGVKRFREQIAEELTKFKWNPMKHLKK